MRTVAALVFLLLCVSSPLSSQTAMERALGKAATSGNEKADVTVSASELEKQLTTAIPETPEEAVLKDPATRAAYLASMQRYYYYRANGYSYRSRVFEWQLLSSKVIFAAVIVLVGAGIYFAHVQFRVAIGAMTRPAVREVSGAAHEASQAVAPSASAGAAPPTRAPDYGQTTAFNTQLEFSEKGFSLSSPVLGVVILGLSLAFFYLYLVYVYPITNVF